MKKPYKEPLAIVLIIAACGLLSGCSARSYASQESMSGALVGTGSGIGWLIGNEVGNTTENVLSNAAIGAGIGMLGGALINEQNIKTARQREVVLREARMISKNQRDLDRLREEIYDASSWGRNEIKPWDRRFQVDQPGVPYQGPVN